MKRIALVMIALSVGVGGCSYVNRRLGLKDDHVGEQFLEEHIKENLGLEIDLTPGSED